MGPRIKLLPLWCITNTRPAFYDVESDTAVEMVGKVYDAMRELQTDYNKYVTEINQTITDFINGTIEDQECFEKRMTKVIHDYLDYLDTKLGTQDKVIADAVAYMKTNLKTSVTEVIEQMKESGELDEAILGAFDNVLAELEKARPLKTVAELRAMSDLAVGDVVHTIGYYSANDGGGASYLIRERAVTDVDDGGSVLVINDNIVAELIVDEKLNVLQFGARGDGVTNDTVALQKYADFCKANDFTFFVPNKAFLADTFTIENVKLIKIEGTILLSDGNQILNIFENVNSGAAPNIFINKVTTGTILMKGLNSADVKIQNANKLRLVADNTENHNFIGYTRFCLGFVRYLEIWDDGSGTKWINENLFIGGRFLGISIDGSYPHQNNLFLKPMCEHTEINFNVGVENRFIDARLEGNISVTFGEDAWGNVITSNYAGTMQRSYTPKQFQAKTIVTDNSGGRNKFIVNEDLIEHNVLNLNVFNNPKNVEVEGDSLKPGNSATLFESDYIELPNVLTCLYFYLSNPKVSVRLECYDENKVKLSSNPNLLISSPTVGYTSAGTYGNAAYTRDEYWMILDNKNEQVKYIKLKFITASTIGEETIKSIETYLTYYGQLSNEGYYLEGFKKCI